MRKQKNYDNIIKKVGKIIFILNRWYRKNNVWNFNSWYFPFITTPSGLDGEFGVVIDQTFAPSVWFGWLKFDTMMNVLNG